MPPRPVRVVSASESAERDRAAIDGGVPSRVLMERAGTGAANEILRRYPQQLRDGAVVFTGPGNNGGDGWVVAGCLAREGVKVTVVEVVAPKSPDAVARKKKLEHWQRNCETNRSWLALNMMTEARAGFRAFNEGPAGHREVDFVELRQRLARGDRWDDRLTDAIQPHAHASTGE